MVTKHGFTARFGRRCKKRLSCTCVFLSSIIQSLCGMLGVPNDVVKGYYGVCCAAVASCLHPARRDTERERELSPHFIHDTRHQRTPCGVCWAQQSGTPWTSAACRAYGMTFPTPRQAHNLRTTAVIFHTRKQAVCPTERTLSRQWTNLNLVCSSAKAQSKRRLQQYAYLVCSKYRVYGILVI